MIREIKFRGLRGCQEWVYGYFVNNPYGKSRIYTKPFTEASSNTWFEVIPETVGQFTGLLDKNGKEIYEGDILGDWVDVDGKQEQSRQTVFWHDQEAQWMLDNSHKQDRSHFFSLAGELKDFEYEIIGNIHENPELVK